MKFAEHFDDIRYVINNERSGNSITKTLYGMNIDDYIDGITGPVNYWSETIDVDSEELSIALTNPLIVENITYEPNDMFFTTKCIGYAVEYGYDSIIIESFSNKYYWTVDFDESHMDVYKYISEASKKKRGPLFGKRISKEKREEIKKRRESDKKHRALKKPTSTNRPKKAPKKGIKVDVLLANTGKLSPDRVERGMKKVRKQPPKLTGVKEVDGTKYFRANYNFKSIDSDKRQLGYADISQDKEYCNELFCTCADFFYRLYAPYVAAGLSTWNIPSNYKTKQSVNVDKAPHNHKWTVDTNPYGKLFLCKHLWAFLAYYVAGDAGNTELSDEEIDDIISKYFDEVSGTDEEENETEFMKAFGNLYVDQKGNDIEHIENKDDVKKSDRRKTFYQLPTNKNNLKDDEVENEEE